MKNKHTDIKKMVMMGAISAIASELCKPIIDDCVSYVKSKALYSISISNILGHITPALHEKFPHFPKRVEVNMGESQYRVGKTVDVTGVEWGFTRDYVDYIIYHGTPIFVKIEKFERVEHGTDSSGAWLYTLNQSYHKERLMEFLDELSETARQLAIQARFDTFNVRMIGMQNGNVDTNWIAHKLRTFDDVFLPSDQKKQLLDAIDAYVNNREFYIENNLPNHFGILLYSEPGHGKSSIAQAIASHINAELIVASGDSISHITEIMDRMSQHSMDDSMYRVLLFEDIDSGLFNLTREKKDKDDEDKNEVGMATILNALDGIGSPTNVIYVFTTNHIEVLDPAFIRPGRCDLKLEIKGVTLETLKEFMQFHYPGAHIRYPHSTIKSGLTFAELQTHVMKGETPEEIIKFAYEN